MATEPVRKLPEFEKQVEVQTNASDRGAIGGVLMQ